MKPLVLVRQGWSIIVVSIALLLSIPLLFIISSLFFNTHDIWLHLAETVLFRYSLNSLILMLGVSIGVFIFGVGTAWLVTLCRWRGCAILEWGLLLPLAFPSYLLAYTYTNFLDYSGEVQTLLRTLFHWETVQDYWFPNIRNIGGAILMFILVLYPYVYLITRVAFLEQSLCTLEASRLLGCNPYSSFWKTALPLARPAIVSGVSLALMETLNDFGTVQYFGVDTFTTGIYRTWFGMGQPIASAQLSALLMFFILGLILLEKWSRRQARYYQTVSRYQDLPRYQLKGLRGFLAFITCFLPVFLGFLLPAILLLKMAWSQGFDKINEKFWELAKNSFTLALITALLAVALALILAYGQRLQKGVLMMLGVRVASMGYAIPGSVIAVGIMIPFGKLDNWLSDLFQSWFNVNTGLLFSGTVTALIFAYLVRFLAVSFGAVDSSLSKIKPSLDEASSSLGHSPSSTLIKVHAPLMWGGLLTAGMLVFVDVMKELSATLVIRPFNFNTLAVQVYQYASDERLVEASLPALMIIIVGIIPVIVLSWQVSQSRVMGISNQDKIF